MKFLRIVCLFASAAALAVAGSIDIEPVEFNNITVPSYNGPKCLAKTVGISPLNGVKVAIVVADGSSADAVAATRTFLNARGAITTVYCARSSPSVINDLSTRALLMRSYYPIGKIKCDVIDSFYTFSKSALVVIPEGYSATLPMRRDERTKELIREFVNVEGLTNASSSSTLLLLGGAAEVLIDSDFIASNEHLACDTNMPYGVTPAVTSAVHKRCHDFSKVAQTHDITIGEKRNILVGTDLSLMLSQFEARYRGSAVPDIRCNNTETTTPFDYETSKNDAEIEDLTEGNLADIISATDADLVVPNASAVVPSACHNAQGVNFCENALTSVVVAHGSHARAVRSLANNVNDLPNINKVFCPETDNEHVVESGNAFVYLSTEPSFFPTHRVRCTAFHNRTDTLANTLIVVPGGEVATHRVLRDNNNLVKAFQYATTFSALGSALTMMSAISNAAVSTNGKKEEGESGHLVTNAPYYINTNVDMSVLGYNSSTATSSEAVMSFRNHEERRTVVLGGYRNTTEFATVVVDFTAFAAKALVWDNAPNGAPDLFVMVYAFGFSGLIVIGILIVLCIRAHSSPSRNARQARSRGSSTTTEPLASKYA